MRESIPNQPNKWDIQLLASDYGLAPCLLQSYAWGELQAEFGWSVARLKFDDGGMAQVLKRRSLFGNGALAYCPRGPVPGKAGWDYAVGKLVEWCKDQHIGVLQFEPHVQKEGFQLTAIRYTRIADIQPSYTGIVRVDCDDSTMISSFKPKTRYNVRLAMRKGVDVKADGSAKVLARLCADTARRQRISLPGEAYFSAIIRHLGEDAQIFIAYLDDVPLAGILVARFGPRAYYLFGGSSDIHREAMPTYITQFEAMKWARGRGCHEYDLWGLPLPNVKNHPYSNLRQFKEGFVSFYEQYPGTLQVVLQPSHALLFSLEASLRRIARHIPRLSSF